VDIISRVKITNYSNIGKGVVINISIKSAELRVAIKLWSDRIRCPQEIDGPPVTNEIISLIACISPS